VNTHHCKKMASVTFNSQSAIENFREYLQVKTVHPDPDYGASCHCHAVSRTDVDVDALK
jgi:hypothetical protein